MRRRKSRLQRPNTNLTVSQTVRLVIASGWLLPYYFDILIDMKYLVVTRKSEYGYDVHVPTLPGCHSQGDTEQEALENIKDAIVTYLGMEKEDLKGAEVWEVEVTPA